MLKGADIPMAILPAGDNNIVAENLGATRTEPHMVLKDAITPTSKWRLAKEGNRLSIDQAGRGERGWISLWAFLLRRGNSQAEKNIQRKNIRKRRVVSATELVEYCPVDTKCLP